MYSVTVVSFLLKEYLWQGCCILEMLVMETKINKISVTIGIANNLPGDELTPLNQCIFVHVIS